MLEVMQQGWDKQDYWCQLHDWMLDHNHPYLPAVEAVIAGKLAIVYDNRRRDREETYPRWDVFTRKYSRSLGSNAADTWTDYSPIWEEKVCVYQKGTRGFVAWTRYSYFTQEKAFEAILKYLAEVGNAEAVQAVS